MSGLRCGRLKSFDYRFFDLQSIAVPITVSGLDKDEDDQIWS